MHFWSPESTVDDKAFNAGAFRDYVDALGISIATVPSRHPLKYAMESKQNIFRSIFTRIKEGGEGELGSILVARKSVPNSIDFYGNDSVPAFELAN